MAKSKMNPSVDFYFRKAKQWREELEELRTIVLGCDVTEALKWGVPCYAVQDHNIVLIHAFKEYCALLFMKGALLKNAEGILVQQTKNVQAARQIRFTDVREILEMKSTVKAYIDEAIALEKAGAKVILKETVEFDMPEEFRHLLNESAALKKAFHALTPGRQRAYLLFFSAAKQSKTREARIEKYRQQILKGKGLND